MGNERVKVENLKVLRVLACIRDYWR